MGPKLRHPVHQLAAGFLHYSGLLRLWCVCRRITLCGEEVLAIGLHRVLTEEEAAHSNSLSGMLLREKTFVKLLEYLSRHFQVVSLDRFLAGPARAGRFSKPWCLLTFDDGWKDNYTTAYPWLIKFGFAATVFLTTGLVEKQGMFWVERLARAWKDPVQRANIQSRMRTLVAKHQIAALEAVVECLKHMSAERRRRILDSVPLLEKTHDQEETVDRLLAWNQVIEMARDGIEFGSHTVTHPLLTYETDSTVNYELRASKEMLEKKLNKRVRAFAYPNGECNPSVQERVKQAGYECAFCTVRGWYVRGQNPYSIRRIVLHEGNVTGVGGKFSPAMLGLTLTWWR